MKCLCRQKGVTEVKLHHNPTLEGSGRSASHSGLFHPQERPDNLLKAAELALGPVWTGVRKPFLQGDAIKLGVDSIKYSEGLGFDPSCAEF